MLVKFLDYNLKEVFVIYCVDNENIYEDFMNVFRVIVQLDNQMLDKGNSFVFLDEYREKNVIWKDIVI